ncbi:hypothetical protein FRX31_016474 [Thalictrum thalictroides]|uniref:Uncharacterized protein n=1 Tax=Thalictrum thalictroides TaxID=46969 RepID=A0A7J6W924_THATH|nr:hypothetical protein FRX31_016474 [Thalictrum thalictroides]
MEGFICELNRSEKGMRKGNRRFSVVKRKAFEFERRVSASLEGRVVITEKGYRDSFKATTSEGGGRWLGEQQGRFVELIFTKKMGRSGLRTLRLPAGKGKEGWADLVKKKFCSEVESEVGRRKEDGGAANSSGGTGKGLDKSISIENSCEGSGFSTSKPLLSGQLQLGEGTSRQVSNGVKILKRQNNSVNNQPVQNEVVDVSDSDSCPPGFEKSSKKQTTVDSGKLIQQECCNLRNKEEVEEWVGTIIGPLTKQLGLSSTNGDEAILKFFTGIGLAKLKEGRVKKWMRKNKKLKIMSYAIMSSRDWS